MPITAVGRCPKCALDFWTHSRISSFRYVCSDEFKSAGVFVNWWQQIRYDLKTIVSIGWHHTLIPDEYLISTFFQSEAEAIEEMEARIGELQTELAEVVETAQEVAAYEPDEDETVTASVIKKVLKTLIDDLKDSAWRIGQARA